MSTPAYTLDDIRRHPAFPFVGWQDDDLQFLMLEMYWAERVRGLLGDDLHGFTPQFDTDRDGNPILTVTNLETLRGLRLVVIENDEGKPISPNATGADGFYGLYGFMNGSRLPDGETPVDELVLLVHLDERFAPYFDQFVTAYCKDGETPDQMEARLQAYEADLKQSQPDSTDDDTDADLPEPE